MDGDLQPLLQLQQHRCWCWLAARARGVEAAARVIAVHFRRWFLLALRPAGAMAAAFEGGDEDGDGGP